MTNYEKWLEVIRDDYSPAAASAAKSLLEIPENRSLGFLDLVALAESHLQGFAPGASARVSSRIVCVDIDEGDGPSPK